MSAAMLARRLEVLEQVQQGDHARQMLPRVVPASTTDDELERLRRAGWATYREHDDEFFDAFV